MENKELFDDVEEELSDYTIKPEDNSETELKEPETTEFKVEVSDLSDKEIKEKYGKKEKADGRILTIKSVSITKPILKKMEDGKLVDVEPKKSNSGTPYYTSKLKIMYNEDNIVEYYPTIYFFLKNDGSVNPKVKLNRIGNSRVSNIVRMAIEKMSNGQVKLVDKKTTNGMSKVPENQIKFDELSQTISDKQILDWLVGKKVKIETVEGIFNGKSWFRNDIVEFL